jgi:hypothetical protein
MSFRTRLDRLEAARVERQCRALAGWSDEELADFLRHSAPAALGLTEEQVAELSDEELADLTAAALAEELGLPSEGEQAWAFARLDRLEQAAGGHSRPGGGLEFWEGSSDGGAQPDGQDAGPAGTAG